MLVVSLQVNGLRLTIGGIVLAFGPGILAFDNKLKLVALTVSVLGFLLVVSGLLKLSRRRRIIYPRWDHDRILKALRRAPETATVQILQTWFPEENFIDRLEDLYVHSGKRYHLRILLMNHDEKAVNDVLSARIKLRWISREKAAADIEQTHERLIRLKRQVDSHLQELARIEGRTEVVDLQIKVYDFMPFGPIYKIGQEIIFAGFYLNYASSVDGPMIEVHKNNSPQLWRVFENCFNKGWDEAASFYPPADAREMAHD